MNYIPQWEQLSQVVARIVAATGVSEQQAQADICQALSDGAIAFRARLKRRITTGMTSNSVLEGAAFDLPSVISAKEIDWEQSRPLNPWLVKRGEYEPAGYWFLDWVKLSASGVTRVLCPAQAHENPDRSKSRATQSRAKRRPTLERAWRAIHDLHPNGVPDQSVLSNKGLCRQVIQKLSELNQPSVSDDTILRAAGRRK